MNVPFRPKPEAGLTLPSSAWRPANPHATTGCWSHGIEHVFLFDVVLLHHDEQGFAIASELVFITCRKPAPRGPTSSSARICLCSPRMTSVGPMRMPVVSSKAGNSRLSSASKCARGFVKSLEGGACASPVADLGGLLGLRVKLVAVPVVGGHGVLDGRHGGDEGKVNKGKAATNS